MDTPNIVSGAVSTVSELGKDEAWLADWLRERPTRLGLGDIDVADGDAGDDDPRSFVATDDDRCFSVDVQLGEIEASRGFGVLDNWARNRVRHPDKTHVAVLVTEDIGERYQTTLETLAEHLPLVVVELQVWRGESEAIVVPHVALSSDEVELSQAPAARAARALAKTAAAEASSHTGDDAPAEDGTAPAADVEGARDANGSEPEVEVPEDKNETGVTDPWGFPSKEAVPAGADDNGNGGRLLSKVGN